MSVRKALAVLALVGIVGAASACSDVTAPQTTHVCQVTSGGQTCTD
jgi:hypothetical protein